MRCLILSSVLALALGGVGTPAQAPPAQKTPPAAQAQQPTDVPTIRRQVNLVNVLFSVVNRRNRFVTDLEKDNFKIFEDKREQKIEFFSRRTDLPLRVALLLDTSNSIRERLKFEQEAAIDYLHNVIRPRKDLALLMTFDNEPSIVQDFADDLSTLTEAIERQRAGGGTALYDAIHYACQQRLMNPPLPPGENPEVRRVLVVISDGDDNLSDHTRSEAIEMAQRAEVAIYAISTNTEWLTTEGPTPQKYHKSPGDQLLEQLAEETGGRVFFPYRIDDLAQSFLDISEELRSQYALAYAPSPRALDGKFHSVRITVDRKGLNVRARKGYYAPRPLAEGSKPAGSPPGR